MWDLDQDARAVAGIGFTAAGAAMAEIEKNGQSLPDDLVGTAALDVDHEAHTAAIFLIGGVVKSLFDGC